MTIRPVRPLDRGHCRRRWTSGRELYDRLAKFVEHFQKVGAGLERAGDSYNSAIGSLERMVLPSSRKLKELHVATDATIESPAPIEIETRSVDGARDEAITATGYES